MPTRRFYVNSAPQQTLASGITNASTSATIQSSFAGWPVSFPFFAVLEAGTANQEVVSVTAITGLVATIVRGQDGSTAVAHNAGATLDQMFVRQDADEANAHTSANSGVHGIAGNVVGDSDVQTLTNKTLTTPTLTSPTISGTAVGSGNLAGSLLFNGGSLIAPINRVYTSSTTWTKPANLRAVRVRVVGGGAAGGAATGGASGRAAGGGGGAGGYAEALIPAASLGATVAVTVGASVAGGSGAGANGNSSSFGTAVVASGGSGGALGANTSAATSTAGGNGGTGTAGDLQVPGGNGGVGLAVATGPAVIGGAGGNSIYGAAIEGFSSAGGANNGNNYGGGGSGATASTATTNGGNGAGGLVIVEEIY